MNEVVLSLTAYREGSLVLRALESVGPTVDRVVLSNCRFAYVKDNLAAADDTVHFVFGWCHRYGIPLRVDRQPGYEHEVRTRALGMVGKGNYCFVLDADEVVTGRPDLAFDKVRKTQHDIYRIGTEGWNDVYHSYESQLMARVFRVSNDLHYHGDHWTLYDGDRLFLSGMRTVGQGYTYLSMPEIRIVNDPARRDSDAQRFRLERYELLRSVGWDELKLPKVQ